MGFEGYGILVNTRELQTHLAATAKGKMYHRLRQKTGKPLENPFIGYVFSEQPGELWSIQLALEQYWCSLCFLVMVIELFTKDRLNRDAKCAVRSLCPNVLTDFNNK